MGHGPQQFGRLGSRCRNDVPRYPAPWRALHAPCTLHVNVLQPPSQRTHAYMCIYQLRIDGPILYIFSNLILELARSWVWGLIKLVISDGYDVTSGA